MTAASTASAEVLIPSSPSEAIEAFGDGDGIVVIGGGTILMPEIVAGRLVPERALLLSRAGLDAIIREGGTVRIGAGTTLEAVAAEAPEPLATAARQLADPEVRRQATLGGNISTISDGDLQAVLLALDATVRHTGSGGERTEPVASYLRRFGGDDERLALEFGFDEPEAGSYTRLDRTHAHPYTYMAVTAVRAGSATKVAAKGASPGCSRLPAVEQALADGASPEDAAARALDDAEPFDDALASAWYRSRVLPTLVARALADL